MSYRTFAGLGLALAAVLFGSTDVSAQATFTPVYAAPYRAFEQHEFGAVLSFPAGSGTDFGLEGQYRFGRGAWDFGLRGGIVDGAGTDFVIGVEGRLRVLDHTQADFPLDGAVVVGLGTAEFDSWILPSAGISLGRRVDLDGFEFVAYGQPTLFLTTYDTGDGNDTDFDFNLGLGVDFKVGEALDLRTSFAFIDGPAEGISFSLVWVN
ncbi:MAG: hypothetical protein AMS19_10540 [Gemmatimonas sp. SG8_23]|nr:MAG: hypothetical protein AMS19_10540 [Gemmatimonas sp. SG8_23]